jgi:hypothetical protein
VFIKVGGRRGGVGVAETLVGVGGEDVGGVSGFTSQFSFVGSLFRYVAVAARPSQRVLSLWCLLTLDFIATRFFGGS